MQCLVGLEKKIIYPTKHFRALFKNTDNCLPKRVKINVDQQFNCLLLQLLKAPDRGAIYQFHYEFHLLDKNESPQENYLLIYS